MQWAVPVECKAVQWAVPVECKALLFLTLLLQPHSACSFAGLSRAPEAISRGLLPRRAGVVRKVPNHSTLPCAGAGMIMSSALFQQGSYDDIVNWIWSLGDISSGGG